MRSLILTAVAAIAPVAAPCADLLAIDPSHTAVVFSWDHRGLSHPVARLEQIRGTLLLEREDLSRSSVEVTMPLAGLHTAVEALDRRLLGSEFLDAAQHPDITFVSTRIDRAGGNALRIAGELSVHGVRRQIVLDALLNKIVVGPDGRVSAGFDAAVTLRRSDFGVTRYVPMTGDVLDVHITVEANQP